MDYEVIDLSAHGPRRGLLLALDCSHQVQPAPVLTVVEAENVRRRADSEDRVWFAIADLWVSPDVLAQRTKLRVETVRRALWRLAGKGLVTHRLGTRGRFFTKPSNEWRRVQ